jgi:hypothetical protein
MTEVPPPHFFATITPAKVAALMRLGVEGGVFGSWAGQV